MAKLYEIDQAILDCIDTETGEIFDEDRLDQLEMERTKKVEGVALWYRNLLSDAEQYKAERQRFEELEKQSKAKAESLKQWLSYALQGEKIKTSRVNITYRKSQSVEIVANSIIPNEYMKYSEPTINKAAIKDALKKGENVPGAMLVESQNIQIK